MIRSLARRWHGAPADLRLLLLAVAGFGLADSLFSAVFNNYLEFRFHLDGLRRTLLELPRELPGLSVAFVSALFAFLPSRRLAAVAGLVGAVGMLCLNFFSLDFFWMTPWLFLYSLGQHLFLPLNQSISMDLAREGKMGQRLGQVNALRNAAAIGGSAVVFVGFHFLNMGFAATFLLAAGSLVLAGIALWRMSPGIRQPHKAHLALHREYGRYYALCVLFGTRKQLFLTFAPWVLVSVFQQSTSMIARLLTIGGVVGIVVQPWVGRMVDRLGERFVLSTEAIALVFVCTGYALAKHVFSPSVSLLVVCLCFLLDQTLMSFGIARSTYLKRIATDPAHVSPTLTMAVSIDHVFSIAIALLGGVLWRHFGFQSVFIAGIGIALLNWLVVQGIQDPKSTNPNPTRGNALALALMVLLIGTFLAAVVLHGTGQGATLAQRAQRQYQARMVAESSIQMKAWEYVFVASDSGVPSGFLRQVPGIQYQAPSLDTTGLWLHIEAQGVFMGCTSHVAAELGKMRHPVAFHYAVRTVDTMAQFQQGGLQVSGPVLLGSASVIPSSTKILQQATKVAESQWSFWTAQLSNLFDPESLQHCEGCLAGNQHLWADDALWGTDTIRVENGDLRADLSSRDGSMTHLRGNHWLMVQGDIEISGEARVDSLTLLSEGDVTLHGPLQISHLNVFSKGGITIEGAPQMEAMLLAQGDITLGDDAIFLPWSFAMTTHTSSASISGNGWITFSGKARFTGYAICSDADAGIVVRDRAKLLGAVYSLGSVRNDGFIGGVTVAQRLICQDSSTTNCPGTGEFMRDSLPPDFPQLPSMSFGEKKALAAVRWRTL
ncbi:MAG TPA: MFS transporter [Fibrobacteraceae bacterium]|nr:MFS transporter [Fibrobacteraceae bacterium]